ncbi:MAG: YqjD family protein [Geminicoccaceae bacterium]
MATSKSTSSDGEFDALKQDLEKIRKDFADLRGHMGALGESKLAEARQSGQASIQELADSLDEMATSLRGELDIQAQRAERNIRERPFLSLAIAFGVGMIFSHLFSSRR